MAEDFNWTATVETELGQEVTLHQSVLELMAQYLQGRTPVFSIRADTNQPTAVSLAAAGETAEQAVEDSENVVKRALGAASIAWQRVECLSVTLNSIVLQDILRIDPYTGILRPEATVTVLGPAKE